MGCLSGRALLALGASTAAVLTAGAIRGAQSAGAQPSDIKPFIIPLTSPPGPNTWLLGQTYGNTTGAYRQRHTTYAAGQGIHFGVDLTAPCGTQIVAMADVTSPT